LSLSDLTAAREIKLCARSLLGCGGQADSAGRLTHSQPSTERQRN